MSRDRVKVNIHSSMSGATLSLNWAAWMWDKVCHDKRLFNTFAAMHVKSLSEFHTFLNDPSNFIVIGSYDEDVAVLAWLNCLTAKSMHAHVGVFRWAYGQVGVLTTQEMLRQFMSLRTNDCYFVNSLIGMTPKENRLAINFAKAVGFTEVGLIPQAFYNFDKGTTHDVVVTYITRDNLISTEVDNG